MHKISYICTEKRKCRHDDSLGIHGRCWSLSSTSPVNIRAVTLANFPFQYRAWINSIQTGLHHYILLQHKVLYDTTSYINLSSLSMHVVGLTGCLITAHWLANYHICMYILIFFVETWSIHFFVTQRNIPIHNKTKQHVSCVRHSRDIPHVYQYNNVSILIHMISLTYNVYH